MSCNNTKVWLLRFIIVFVISTTSQPLLANTTSKLKQLNEKIADIKEFLFHEKSKRSKYVQELKKTEISSGKILLKLNKTQHDLRKQQKLLQRLKKNTTTYQKQLQQQKKAVSQHIREAYLLSRQPYLKLILNHSNAENLSRMLTYYEYINRDRISAIHQLRASLSQLQDNQKHLQEQTKVLKKIQAEAEKERHKLEQIQRDRKRIIHQINSKIHNKHQKLNELLANKRLLEKTLRRLKRQSRFRANQNSFAKLKGKLTWPTKGKILPYFGTKIYHSQLKWGGILIEAREDQPIHAIADGKVVFAKWLPGYGLLLIITHGHGYMTLYGRNHNIYKKPGDIVQKGDLIATVGNSGGYKQPALYFAIRHNAKPLNPINWCNKKA